MAALHFRTGEPQETLGMNEGVANGVYSFKIFSSFVAD